MHWLLWLLVRSLIGGSLPISQFWRSLASVSGLLRLLALVLPIPFGLHVGLILLEGLLPLLQGRPGYLGYVAEVPSELVETLGAGCDRRSVDDIWDGVLGLSLVFFGLVVEQVARLSLVVMPFLVVVGCVFVDVLLEVRLLVVGVLAGCIVGGDEVDGPFVIHLSVKKKKCLLSSLSTPLLLLYFLVGRFNLSRMFSRVSGSTVFSPSRWDRYWESGLSSGPLLTGALPGDMGRLYFPWPAWLL